ncbi:MAG: hypothetical protein M3Z36_04610 [Acidobacteriota bacterium]|nr:hypothetical protein [Acidobacteriota bacterium]
MPDKIGPTFRDLIAHEDEAFIQAAYRAILGRTPLPSEGPLEELRRGTRKSSILRALRNSEEGRARKARIPGLRLHSVIEAARTLPVVGYAAALIFDLLNFPALVTQVVSTNRLSRQLQKQIEALGGKDRSLSDSSKLEDRVAVMTMELACLVDVKHQRLQSQISEIAEILDEIKVSLAGVHELSPKQHSTDGQP